MALRTTATFAAFSLIAWTGAVEAAPAPPHLLGFYVGAGLANANPQGTFEDPFGIGAYPATRVHLGWDASVGIRPFRWLGAEVQYMDFGYSHVGPSSTHGTEIGLQGPNIFYGADGHTYAAAAFAVGYLPLPWKSPWFDLFGKVGVAQLWTKYSYSVDYSSVNVCHSFPLPAGCTGGHIAGAADNNEINVAYGGGAQVHLGRFALRAEYEGVYAKRGNPNLFAVEVLWTPKP